MATNSLLSISFSEGMEESTIIAGNFSLEETIGGAPIPFTVDYTANGNLATITPTSDMPANTEVTAMVETGVTDDSDNALAAPFSWTFTTGAAPDATAPTVSSTVPQGGDTGVAINTSLAATFSEPMDPLTIPGNFTLAGPGTTDIPGTADYALSGNTATFTPTADLPPNELITATISTGVQDAATNALAAEFTWTFMTGAAQDTTPPIVTTTNPANGEGLVSLNALITATFSDDMDPLSITTASFTLTDPLAVLVDGTAGYATNGRVATFTPTADLEATSTYTAELTTVVTDAAGNPLAAAFSWTFTTGTLSDLIGPTVLSSNPDDGATGICINRAMSVTFSESMDPLSISTATFLVEQTTGSVPVAGVVTYDAMTDIATFDPNADLIGTPPTGYTVTIVGGENGVKDGSGNPLLADEVTSFTTDASTCTEGPALGAIAPFGGLGGSATLTNDGLDTVINGDIAVNGASTTVTGLHDSTGTDYTVTTNNDGQVNGIIYTQTTPPGFASVVTQAAVDAQLAFDSLSPGALPGGIDVSSLAECPTCGGAGGGPDELGGRTLPPGIYLSTTGTYTIGAVGELPLSLTLDAEGDADAVWVFQTAAGTGTLTVGLTGPATPATPIQVLLINGAQAKNVYWYVPGGASIGTGSTMVGSLFADASITISTTGGIPPTAVVTTLNGRAIALTAAVTMTNTVINVPPK